MMPDISFNWQQSIPDLELGLWQKYRWRYLNLCCSTEEQQEMRQLQLRNSSLYENHYFYGTLAIYTCLDYSTGLWTNFLRPDQKGEFSMIQLLQSKA